MKELKCDMLEECTDPVTHIDNKGFIYCKVCGEHRKMFRPCRKLTNKELNLLKNGKTLKEY